MHNKAKHNRPMQKAALGWTSLSLGLCWRRYATMKLSSLFTVLIFMLSANVEACIISPFQRMTIDTEQKTEGSEIVFFGSLKSVETAENGAQTATFQVIKAYKGKIEGLVTIVNDKLSSCFRPFQTVNSAYYIFANQIQNSSNYSVSLNSNNGFIPLEYAVENNWNIE